VHAPIIAVPMYRKRVLELRRRRKAPAIGAIIAAMKAGLDTMYPFLDKMQQESMSRICLCKTTLKLNGTWIAILL